MAPDRRFLVLHGWQNRRPTGHWQFELVHDLRSRGERVQYPQFPDPDLPDLDLWTEWLLAELDQLGSGERVVIAHSLAVLLWMQVADSLSVDRRADRLLRLDTDVISGGRHLDLDAGYGEWPSALAWCPYPEVRLAAPGLTR